ncbi:hypothetical protein [Reinekea blandensis]|uniref:Uncharacterized protein n=1 Tax=Reinekea blandensis MED297 TaxID=314283 RepID=A4BBD0_9GAMM|nr:hypothetical protein [Reinekea blandensis]EAR10743.1 hypothetical protein MED297_12025 [Reinekea sp. MED297] [Reinekea blandensis MED297]
MKIQALFKVLRFMMSKGKFYLLAFLTLSTMFIMTDFQYSLVSLKEYLNVLLLISTVIFTIMGLWIAILYPSALNRLANPRKVETADFSETGADTKRLESLVATVMKSAIVVFFIMVIFLAGLTSQAIDLEDSTVSIIKQITFSFVVMLSFVQSEALFYVIKSNILFLSDFHQKRSVIEDDKSFFEDATNDD